ncbi:hypothetical protein [Streptomyces sp. NPDC059009]|uniref:hypothetical protein n=1 Tax=Streptomyces sp. NPDC059009 TaxID=3346694 RepID=UPI0036CBB0D4
MGHIGPYVQLRPPGGGREWDADPARVRAATPDEQLHANVTETSLNKAAEQTS